MQENMSILDMIQEKCPNGVEYKKLKDVTILNGLKQLSAKDVQNLNMHSGSIKLLPSSRDYDWFCNYSEKLDEYIHNGKVITLGRARHANTKYWEGKFISSQNNLIRSVDENVLYTKYLYYLIICHEKDFYIETGTYPLFNKKAFEALLIPLPPIEIQQEIANILDRFEELEKELEKELKMRIDQYEYYRNMLLSFDDSVEKKKLGDTSIFNFHYGQGNTIPKDKGIFPVYGCNGIVAHTTKYNCENTCVIGHIGSAGVVNWIEGKAFVTYNGTICEIVDDKKVNQKYLYYYLTSIDLKQYVKGNQPFLSVSDFSHVKIPLPSIEKQEAIVEILDQFDELCTSLTNGIPAEIAMRKEQYEYYRNLLLNFKNINEQ